MSALPRRLVPWVTAQIDRMLENVCAQAVRAVLDDARTGVYCGWATVGAASADAPLYKAAVSIGWNPVRCDAPAGFRPGCTSAYRSFHMYVATIPALMLMCGRRPTLVTRPSSTR